MNFSCDRCAKRYSLDDAKVPPGGFRVTCKQCGNIFTVKPPAPPTAQPPALPLAQPPAPAAAPTDAPAEAPTSAPAMAAAAPSLAIAAEPPPGHHADPHERFFASAPGSHDPGQTEEWNIPPGGRTRSYLPLMALGAFVIIGLVASGLWGSRQAVEGQAGPGSNRERRSGWIEGASDAPSPAPAPAAAPAIPAPGPELEPERPLAPRGGGVAATGGLVRPEAMSSGHDQNRAGPPIARKDKRLLDLLDRKQDAARVAAPAAGELNTGRASLDEATVRKTLADNSGAFSACIAKAAKADPRISGEKRTQVLELVVRSNGRVTQATLYDPAYAKTPLGLCLGAAARRIIFPSFEGEEILVQAPLRLSAVQ